MSSLKRLTDREISIVAVEEMRQIKKFLQIIAFQLSFGMGVALAVLFVSPIVKALTN